MCARVKSCHLLCPAMGWNVMSLKLHYSLGNSSVLQSTTPEYKGLLQYNPVLQSTTPVLLCTRKYDSSTTPVLLQYYSVLQRTSPPVLLQYYSVLQSPTPVLRSTTPLLLQYYSVQQYYKVLQSATLCYKVLLQRYKVPQSATPVLQSTTQYYSTTPELQSTTLYYKVLLRYYFETSFTLRTATGIALTPHQILPLPRKMNVMIGPAHI